MGVLLMCVLLFQMWTVSYITDVGIDLCVHGNPTHGFKNKAISISAQAPIAL